MLIPMASTATAQHKQLNFIESLVGERTAAVGVTDKDAFMGAIRSERITVEGASKLIDFLLATPKDAPVVVPGTADNRGSLKFNGYAGNCALCGGHVAVRMGTYRPKATGRGFDTLHLPGECIEKATTIVAGDSKSADSWDYLKHLTTEEFPDGGFAVPAVSGNNDLTFFTVKSNKGAFDPSKKGQRIFKHVVGGDREYRVTPAFFVKCMEAAKAAGLVESMRLYSIEFQCCARCGKSLTVEESRNVGFGSECLKRVGAL